MKTLNKSKLLQTLYYMDNPLSSDEFPTDSMLKSQRTLLDKVESAFLPPNHLDYFKNTSNRYEYPTDFLAFILAIRLAQHTPIENIKIHCYLLRFKKLQQGNTKTRISFDNIVSFLMEIAAQLEPLEKKTKIINADISEFKQKLGFVCAISGDINYIKKFRPKTYKKLNITDEDRLKKKLLFYIVTTSESPMLLKVQKNLTMQKLKNQLEKLLLKKYY